MLQWTLFLSSEFTRSLSSFLLSSHCSLALGSPRDKAWFCPLWPEGRHRGQTWLSWQGGSCARESRHCAMIAPVVLWYSEPTAQVVDKSGVGQEAVMRLLKVNLQKSMSQCKFRPGIQSTPLSLGPLYQLLAQGSAKEKALEQWNKSV